MQTATENTPTEAPSPEASATMAAFNFVTELTRELNKGTVDLPSFPDIAMKVKRVLEDDNASSATVARVVSSEPGLASRVLKMANSAANSRGGAILDVPRAVGRLGHIAIRTLAVSFAMQNLMDSRSVAELKTHLNDLWNHSVHVSAIARALAQNCAGVDPDEAMFVGLIHDVGKLYILTKIESYPELFSDDDSINELLDTWHVAISQSIVENWEFAQPLIDAVALHEDSDIAPSSNVGLPDVLCAANILSNQLENKTIADFDFETCQPFRRVDLTPDSYAKIMEDSKEEITAMMSALNG
ncbi:MAG: HDOD domain-containing protein [Gammaproteobacteria bacterium]